MKKCVFTLLLFCASFLTFAQPEQGQVLLTGSLSYAKTFADKEVYSIAVEGGYLTSGRNALGLSMSYVADWAFDSFSGDIYLQDNIFIGLFDKKYIGLSEDSKFFVTLTSKAQYFKYTFDTNTTEGFIVSLSPGFTFFPTRKIGLDLSMMGLAYAKAKEADDGDFSVNLNFATTSIGVSFLIGK